PSKRALLRPAMYEKIASRCESNRRAIVDDASARRSALLSSISNTWVTRSESASLQRVLSLADIGSGAKPSTSSRLARRRGGAAADLSHALEHRRHLGGVCGGFVRQQALLVD